MCLNQALAFDAPSNRTIFAKYCILMPGPKGLGRGVFFMTIIVFAERQNFAGFSVAKADVRSKAMVLLLLTFCLLLLLNCWSLYLFYILLYVTLCPF